MKTKLFLSVFFMALCLSATTLSDSKRLQMTEEGFEVFPELKWKQEFLDYSTYGTKTPIRRILKEMFPFWETLGRQPLPDPEAKSSAQAAADSDSIDFRPLTPEHLDRCGVHDVLLNECEFCRNRQENQGSCLIHVRGNEGAPAYRIEMMKQYHSFTRLEENVLKNSESNLLSLFSRSEIQSCLGDGLMMVEELNACLIKTVLVPSWKQFQAGR